MRLFIALLTFVFFTTLPPARAGDIFLKNDPAGAQGETAPHPYIAPMGTPQAAPAEQPYYEQQQPATQTQANGAEGDTITTLATRYYKNCVSKDDPILKEANLQLLCTCAAQKMMEVMTVDDIKTMATETQEGQFQRNRLLLQVYAPCMQYPARSLLYGNCVGTPEIQSTVPGYEIACACMADRMASYVSENATTVVAQNLQANPADSNPLQSLMNRADFKARAQAELGECIAAGAQAPASPQTAPPPAPYSPVQ